MSILFPFPSSHEGKAGEEVYHTSPHCRIAQNIAVAHRLPGTGTDRHECPFCFVLTQFQASREQRAARTQDPHTPPGSYEARLQALDE